MAKLVDVTEVNESKVLEVKLVANGTQVNYNFRFDEEKIADAEVCINGTWMKVAILRKAIEAFVDRNPMAFEE